MKVIFLDIDGVLNSEVYCKWVVDTLGYRHGYGGFFPPDSQFTVEDVIWDPIAVRVLDYIVSETDAKIVISSTWRHNFPLESFDKMFALYGVKFDIIDMTPTSPRRLSSFQGFRGDEVNLWLDNNPVDSHVILDDGTDFYPDQPVIYTNPDVGLTWNDAHGAVRKLN